MRLRERFAVGSARGEAGDRAIDLGDEQARTARRERGVPLALAFRVGQRIEHERGNMPG